MFKRLCILGILWLVACGGWQPLPTLQPTAVWPSTALPQTGIPPTLLPAMAITITPSPFPTTTRISLAADTAVPLSLITAAQKVAQQNLAYYRWTAPDQADLVLTPQDGQPLARWVYAVAAPFATLTDDITLADLQASWQGTAMSPAPILVSEAVLVAMTPILGLPGPTVEVVREEDIVARLWGQQTSTSELLLSILPFDQLTPTLKVLSLDGISPLTHEFSAGLYPLIVDVGVVGEATAVAHFLALWDGPITNRDPAKLSRVALTGVTALVRATASRMEQQGILWPGEEVGLVLRTADITHISHEVSFAPDCPDPDPVGGTTFCSRDAYFGLIQDMGADVVELTGNHLNDWGYENTLRTVDMYKAAGMRTFGGGRDLAEAAQPAFMTHNGNQFAFVGCNSFGPAFAWATMTAPGAMPCDGSLPAQIARLRQAGYLVIATLQFTEYYQYGPTADQEAFFKAVAEAGAAAVSGSQGHHAQGFAFHHDAFIHYGLGNLFFDQMDMLGTRQTFVDTYIVYDGRLLSVELWTGLIEHYARPRLMTPTERAQLLTAVFQASGWPMPSSD